MYDSIYIKFKNRQNKAIVLRLEGVLGKERGCENMKARGLSGSLVMLPFWLRWGGLTYVLASYKSITHYA